MLKIVSLVNQMKVVLIVRTNSSNIRCTESLPQRGRGTALAVDEESTFLMIIFRRFFLCHPSGHNAAGSRIFFITFFACAKKVTQESTPRNLRFLWLFPFAARRRHGLCDGARPPPYRQRPARFDQNASTAPLRSFAVSSGSRRGVCLNCLR